MKLCYPETNLTVFTQNFVTTHRIAVHAMKSSLKTFQGMLGQHPIEREYPVMKFEHTHTHTSPAIFPLGEPESGKIP